MMAITYFSLKNKKASKHSCSEAFFEYYN